MSTEPPFNSEPRYRRQVAYGLGHRGRKSMPVERRSKRSFRRWMRRKIKHG